jgi:hypothetical protein
VNNREVSSGHREITDDEVLTQVGAGGGGRFRFRTSLRDDRDPPERSMSLLLGRFTPETGAATAFRRPTQPGRDACRYTTAGRLRAAGFTVRHTPTKMVPDHVSVYRDGDWTAEVARVFDACFGVPEGGSA